MQRVQAQHPWFKRVEEFLRPVMTAYDRFPGLWSFVHRMSDFTLRPLENVHTDRIPDYVPFVCRWIHACLNRLRHDQPTFCLLPLAHDHLHLLHLRRRNTFFRPTTPGPKFKKKKKKNRKPRMLHPQDPPTREPGKPRKRRGKPILHKLRSLLGAGRAPNLFLQDLESHVPNKYINPQP